MVVIIRKQKVQNSVNRKNKFKDSKNCLEATQLENKINHPGKNEIDKDSLKKDHKKLIKINELILETQLRFKCERYNVFF